MKLIKTEKMKICLECALEGEDDECTHATEDLKFVLVLPDCCSTVREACFPYVKVNFKDEDYNNPLKWSPSWHIPENIDWVTRQLFRTGKDKYKTFKVCNCPFCGTSLPEIVLEEILPQPIISTDDCGHCDCGWPRSFDCPCWPRVAAFKTKD